MRISRLRIDGGFLAGLDLEFQAGLNVVIGPRGSGKTSIVELLRFALGAEAITERARGSVRETASAVLRDGQVTAQVESEEEGVVTSTRRAEDNAPNTDGPFRRPLIFAQNEIEAIGVQAAGRTALLDRFRPGRTTSRNDLQAAREEVSSLTAEIVQISRELHSYVDQASAVPSLRKELAEGLKEEARLMKLAATSVQEQAYYLDLQQRAGAAAGERAVVQRVSMALDGWAARLEKDLALAPRLEESDAPTLRDTIRPARAAVERSKSGIATSLAELRSHVSDLVGIGESLAARAAALEAESRSIRARLDEVGSGASSTSRRVQLLRERLAQAESVLSVAESHRKQLRELMLRRRRSYGKLDGLRRQRFDERKDAADKINVSLAPQVRVQVESGGVSSEYLAAIEAGLRGSGMHAKNLAPLLAETLTPLELAEAVESDDAATISERASVALERAVRIVEALRDTGTADIVSAGIEDSVSFQLLDGADYKATDALSTGQRCALVLAIVLLSPDSVVVLDQPEDHLDNAYVVSTLVKSLLTRGVNGQTIVTTHNANIPVLGDAAQVTLLGSDGRRGFVVQSRPLLDPLTIDSITTLMEGGREAFRRRAEMYQI